MSEVNTAPLLPAIQDGKVWISRFTGKEYDKAFQEYCARFAPLYREALLSAGEAAALAEPLLDGIAGGWARQKFWNRSVALMNDKQMIVCYLSPMLLEDPFCAPLAEALQTGWAARWPKEAYSVAPLAKLRRGFRPTFLGITLPFKNDGGDE